MNLKMHIKTNESKDAYKKTKKSLYSYPKED